MTDATLVLVPGLLCDAASWSTIPDTFCKTMPVAVADITGQDSIPAMAAAVLDANPGTLLVAGHETTVNLIGNGTLALLNNPAQLELLRNSPDLAESAVEELLRYDSPVMTAEMGFAREEMTLHGVTISKGATVLPALLSANRDETVFANADQLDLTRSPNRHLAFGQGIHYCLGSPLARLEGKIAFNTLLARAPALRLAVEPAQIKYRNVMILHGLTALPVCM